MPRPTRTRFATFVAAFAVAAGGATGVAAAHDAQLVLVNNTGQRLYAQSHYVSHTVSGSSNGTETMWLAPGQNGVFGGRGIDEEHLVATAPDGQAIHLDLAPTTTPTVYGGYHLTGSAPAGAYAFGVSFRQGERFTVSVAAGPGRSILDDPMDLDVPGA